MATSSGLFGNVKLPPWEPDRRYSSMSLGAFIAVPVLLGMLVGFVTQKDVLTWYRGLKKPSWQPPAFIFGPVWSAMYALMGLASWLVWTHGGFETQQLPLTLYGIQLMFNLAWNPTFFLFHKMELAFWDILALVATLSLTIWSFHKVEPLAALLLLPYLAWVIFATFLNSTLINLNPQETESGRVLKKEVGMSPVGGIGEVKRVDPLGAKAGPNRPVLVKKEE